MAKKVPRRTGASGKSSAKSPATKAAASAAKEADEKTLPDWLTRDVIEPYRAGIASVFILHGDTNCLVRNPDVGERGEEDYITMRKFLDKIFEERELVVNYNIAPGVWCNSPAGMALFRKVADIDEAADKKPAATDAVSAALAGLTAKRGVPREPEACFPLIDKALNRVEGTAVIVEAAHTVLPNAGPSGVAPTNERALAERVRIWARSTKVRGKRGLVLLMTDQASKVSSEIRLPDSEVRTVFIPKPDKAERRRYIVSYVRGSSMDVPFDDSLRVGGDAKKGALDVDTLAHVTQGMSLRQINELFLRAEASRKPLGLSFVKDKKRELLNAEFGDLMEVIEPERGLEDIGGHEHIKAFFRGVLEAIRTGESRLVPMGVTLTGPPGTGKTAIVESLAKEAGFNFVKMKNLRTMWLGESEARQEKALAGLRAMAPVVVMNDEADLAEAGRDSVKGDSGVSERMMKAWMELLSDPKIRGQIIVINCTNRPDRMDAALKRTGRSDERILMPMPNDEERAKIFEVMFKRHRLPTDIGDFGAFVEATVGLSGADIEGITLSSFRFASLRGEKRVSAQALLDAIEDFIPSNNMAEIDLMTMVGLLECSSRRLLPPHILDIVNGIVERNLVPELPDKLERLAARKILSDLKLGTPKTA